MTNTPLVVSNFALKTSGDFAVTFEGSLRASGAAAAAVRDKAAAQAAARTDEASFMECDLLCDDRTS
jgi:hypothetical protein